MKKYFKLGLLLCCLALSGCNNVPDNGEDGGDTDVLELTGMGNRYTESSIVGRWVAASDSIDYQMYVDGKLYRTKKQMNNLYYGIDFLSDYSWAQYSLQYDGKISEFSNKNSCWKYEDNWIKFQKTDQSSGSVPNSCFVVDATPGRLVLMIEEDIYGGEWYPYLVDKSGEHDFVIVEYRLAE